MLWHHLPSMFSYPKPTFLHDAALAFDVDPKTGFMPSAIPLDRLPSQWEPWEAALDDATASRLQVGDKVGLTEQDKVTSERWRAKVRRLPLLSTQELESSATLLRRAHLVLAFLMHFYIQSLPTDAQVVIPRPISLPILRVSAVLDIPPLLTYSDTVLYNWFIDSHLSSASASSSEDSSQQLLPTVSNIRSRTLFSGLLDEEEFYLCSARIELRGVEALELMRATMDEISFCDSKSAHRVSGYLASMSAVIDDLKTILMDVRRGCRPKPYYNEVRPWFRGEDSDDQGRKWTFEGVEEDPDLQRPKELSGPSAGQSSIVHVLDLFLGVDHQTSGRPPSPPSRSLYHVSPSSHPMARPIERSLSAPSTSDQSIHHPPPPPPPPPPPMAKTVSAPASTGPGRPSFMSRMQTYMPHGHRRFLNHLAANSHVLRAFVATRSRDTEPELLVAYNRTVQSLKEFRDAHMIIAATFILSPARQAAKLKAQLQPTTHMPDHPPPPPAPPAPSCSRSLFFTPSVLESVLERLGMPGFAQRTVTTAEKRDSTEEGTEKTNSDRNIPQQTQEPAKAPCKGTGGTDLVKFLKDTRNRTTETMLT